MSEAQNVPVDSKLHPSVVHVLQFFQFAHLPTELQTVSAGFSDLAHKMTNYLPANAETTVMLRKLLEAKDCAVRAKLAKP